MIDPLGASLITFGTVLGVLSLRPQRPSTPDRAAHRAARGALTMSLLTSCPRFSRCSAPVCPLDAHAPAAVHRRGEPVCSLAAEAVKPGGPARVIAAAPLVADAVLGGLPVLRRHPDIRTRLARAESTASRMRMHGVEAPTPA